MILQLCKWKIDAIKFMTVVSRFWGVSSVKEAGIDLSDFFLFRILFKTIFFTQKLKSPVTLTILLSVDIKLWKMKTNSNGYDGTVTLSLHTQVRLVTIQLGMKTVNAFSDRVLFKSQAALAAWFPIIIWLCQSPKYCTFMIRLCQCSKYFHGLSPSPLE